MRHVTLDTQLRLPGDHNRAETVFRHLERGDLKLLIVTGRGPSMYVADLVASPGLHWKMTKDSFMAYVTRRMGGTVSTIAYDDWTSL